MSSILLFSKLTKSNTSAILSILFTDVHGKVFAYMPSGGVKESDTFVAEWEEVALRYGARFVTIDNTSLNRQEHDKLMAADVLLISGGNTFQLMHNLRSSGLDSAIIAFSRMPQKMLAGFSAGAIVMTPSIGICTFPDFEANSVGLTDFNGLGIVGFEVFPHYDKQLHSNTLASYRATSIHEVLEITNDSFVSQSNHP